jgi:hypothetical protein
MKASVDAGDNKSDGDDHNPLVGDRIPEQVAQGQAEKEVETEVQVKKSQSAEDSEQESSFAGVEDPN